MRSCHVPAVLLSLALASALCAADPPKAELRRPSIPPPPAVVVPTPPPAPVPGPGAAIVLPEGVDLLVSHDAKCLVRVFPPGRASVRTVKVPAGRDHTLSGTFVDPKDGGKTTTEDQTFTGPCWVYRVRAREDGPAVLLVATGVDDDEVQVVYVDCRLKPRPPPPPPKPPTPPDPKPPVPLPDGDMGLIKASRDGLARVADPGAAAAALARANRAHASAVAAGAYPTAAAVLKGWRDANNDAVKPNAAAWRPWAESVSARLEAVYGAGKIKGNADWAAAFAEIADGLEGGK